ncbi:glycosyltransferase [Gracilimonas sp.]|uniref:glycosyltransferase n=1 Tax=Gracilimonas sp. TaxID=1974203 RepID=UPI00287129FD|nr:hypothetical protein [Gracilimonas sp.]
METTSLDEVYASLNEDADTIFVVPLIRHSHKKTDYLYLLYKKLIESDDYNINSISVFSHFKLITGILTNRNAILHYHWLEFQDFKSLLGMPWKMLCIYLFHLLGGKIVWTLHNEFPHDQKYLKLHSFLHQKMANWADLLHVHCKTAVSIMSLRLNAPQEKFKLVPHPEFPASPLSSNKAREQLNEHYNITLYKHNKVFLMFGNISQYKQIKEVAEIVIDIEEDCYLMIAGPVKKGNNELYYDLKELDENHERIVLIPDFIEEDMVPVFYSAADVCVFNYREILSSGGYHMAKAYNKPVIAPNLGCLSEEGDQSNVHLFESQEELRLLMTEFLSS